MAIPSSPPVLPELDLPSSPASNSQSNSQVSARGRKRPLSEYGSLSSDPLFSEDVSEVDFENEGPRRKRLVRGPWWTLKHRRGHDEGLAGSSRVLQSTDSGVFMGSDDSSNSAGLRSPSVTFVTQDPEIKKSWPEVQPMVSMGPEERAKAAISQALEDGNEVIDMTNLGLRHLSDQVLRPLRQLIRRPHLDEDHLPSEDDYTPLTPAIQVYLSNNKLNSLPAELFNLTSIIVLSLRNNEITNVPHSVSRFTALRELNLAGNELRQLPWEILRMLHTTLVSLQPNNFSLEQINILDEDVSFTRHLDIGKGDRLMAGIVKRAVSDYKKENPDDNWRFRPFSVFLGASSMVHNDVTGRPMTYPQIKALHNQPGAGPGVSSLYDTALRKIQKEGLSQQALETCAGAPMSLRDGLTKAITADDFGNELCSTCGREMIIPRATWTEYWWHDDLEADFRVYNIYPFSRRACTIRCATTSRPGTYVYAYGGIMAMHVVS